DTPVTVFGPFAHQHGGTLSEQSTPSAGAVALDLLRRADASNRSAQNGCTALKPADCPKTPHAARRPRVSVRRVPAAACALARVVLLSSCCEQIWLVESPVRNCAGTATRVDVALAGVGADREPQAPASAAW